MPLYIELKPGDSFNIGSSNVRVESKSGGKVRLAVDSEYRVSITRAEDMPARPARAESAAPAPPFQRPKSGN